MDIGDICTIFPDIDIYFYRKGKISINQNSCTIGQHGQHGYSRISKKYKRISKKFQNSPWISESLHTLIKNGKTYKLRSSACYDTRDLLARLSQATSPADIQGALASVPMPGKQQVAALPRAAVGTRIIIRPGSELTSKEKLTERIDEQGKARN